MGIAKLLIRVVDALYVPIFRRVVSRNIFAYGVCGGANMALDTLWYFLLYHYVVCERFINLGVVVMSPHIAALCLVFPITFFTGFWLNRNVAFRVTHLHSRRQLLRYALTVVGSILLNYVCMKLLVESFNLWPTPSKILTTIISVAYSYLVARYYTFTTKNNE
jgi:hypothetical protein